MRRAIRVAAVALPPLALAVAGLAHPVFLTRASAPVWRDLHVVTLPLFPLLGAAGWLVLREVSRPLAVIAALLGYVFAAGYTALDVLAGIGAGALQAQGLTGEGVLFGWADALARPATIALLLVAVLATVRLIPLRPALAIPGGVLAIAASVSFTTSHIFPPRGVVTMVVLAAGWALLALVPRSAPASPGGRGPDAAGQRDTVAATAPDAGGALP